MSSIAWNCSTETARTVAFAMPFLTQAKQITVVQVQRGTVPGPAPPSSRTICSGTAWRSSGARCRWATRSVGDVILREAQAAGADLVVKGAYTQSRLRQMIFGGATSHILAEAELPVIMAN